MFKAEEFIQKPESRNIIRILDATLNDKFKGNFVSKFLEFLQEHPKMMKGDNLEKIIRDIVYCVISEAPEIKGACRFYIDYDTKKIIQPSKGLGDVLKVRAHKFIKPRHFFKIVKQAWDLDYNVLPKRNLKNRDIPFIIKTFHEDILAVLPVKFGNTSNYMVKDCETLPRAHIFIQLCLKKVNQVYSDNDTTPLGIFWHCN